MQSAKLSLSPSVIISVAISAPAIISATTTTAATTSSRSREALIQFKIYLLPLQLPVQKMSIATGSNHLDSTVRLSMMIIINVR